MGFLFGSRGPQGLPGAAGTPGTPGQTVGNAVLDGGEVVHLTNLTVRVSAAVFIINGVSYTSPQTDLTFSTAHATLDRIDTIAFTTNNTVVIVAGTAAANPFEPVLDPSTQLRDTAITVKAGATALVTTNTIIFTEGGAESWTETASGAPMNVASATTPITGAIDCRATDAVNGNYFQFANATDFDTTIRPLLALTIKNITALPNQKSLVLQWYDGTIARGTPVTLRNGLYGFSGTNLTTAQQIGITMQAFGVNGLPVETLRATVTGGGGTWSFQLDDVFMQAGIAQTTALAGMEWKGPYSATTQYVLNDVVSSAGRMYVAGASLLDSAPPASGWTDLAPDMILTLTDGATVNWNTGAGRVAAVIFGGNRMIAAPTNLVAGATYILFAIQDATGSRVPTWNAVFKWPGGVAPTLTTTANAIDILTFVCRGGNLHGVEQKAFA